MPIRCHLCRDVHWKYNAEQHLTDKHPEREGSLPEEFLRLIQISAEEKTRLGIPEEAVLGASSQTQVGQKRPASPPSAADLRAGKRSRAIELEPLYAHAQAAPPMGPYTHFQTAEGTVPPLLLQPLDRHGFVSQQSAEATSYHSYYPYMYSIY